MDYIGIDLAGPKNHFETSLAHISQNHISIKSNLNDIDILDYIKATGVKNIGIDAPLSYSMYGGYRDGDKKLKELLTSKGFTKLGVMAPTFNRMIYLTARGIRITRLLERSLNGLNIFEAFPGGYFSLSGYTYNLVTSVKETLDSVEKLYIEVENRGYIFRETPSNDHEIMAVGVALAVESHLKGRGNFYLEKEEIDCYPIIS